MTVENKNLESQESNEQENEVQDGENSPDTENETSGGTENEGSEETGQEGQAQSEDGSDQEAAKSEQNKRAANHRISNRMRKLKGELSQSESGKQNVENQLAIANQQIQILQLSNNQRGNPSKPVEPNPSDFEEGVQDPKYVKKYQDYLRVENQQQIQQEVAKQAKSIHETVSTDNHLRNKERKERDHYRRAIEGNTDYEDKEDAAIEILGKAAIEDIIANFDDSDKIIYQLGADESLALDVADAMENKDHVQAVRLLERASRGLKPKSKTNNKTTPDPDQELEGGSPGKSKHAGRGPKGATFE